MELRKHSSWMVDEHLERSGVGAGSTMMEQDLPGELEATVAREKQHVRWVWRHQPANSYLAVCYDGEKVVQGIRFRGGRKVMYELSKIIGKNR